MKRTIQFSVAEITADLQKGVPDGELMMKYGLSEKGLNRVFDRLLRAACNGSHHIEVEYEGKCPDDLKRCNGCRLSPAQSPMPKTTHSDQSHVSRNPSLRKPGFVASTKRDDLGILILW